MTDFRTLLIAIPSLPLLAAIMVGAAGLWRQAFRSEGTDRENGVDGLLRKSHGLVVFAIAGSFVCSFLLLLKVDAATTAQNGTRLERFEHVETLWTWASVERATTSPAAGATGNFQIDVALRADSLTAIMLCMVTFIATLVAIYASGYMHGDRSYWRFFAYVSLFVFSMTMLVLVSNFLLLFVFWEAVGACSYLLIGFWYEKPEAAAAGKKAFLVNRVGDFGFALALFLIWTTYGSLNYHDTAMQIGVLGEARLSGQAAFVGGGTALAICLLLMLGACGKSAQFPLHVWLPDAMEGPTPVSALIHAATMVTAGVYMVTRCTPLFMMSPDAQLTVASIGGFTALMAGLIALTQNDLKRVLAYSTISQLGYMFLALGTGTVAGIAAAMFHLFTHAFFKALLFLGAGSVMHGMGNVIDMRRFGGLRRIMPITCMTFAIGCIALAGIPPLSGFWSKDAILGAVHDRMHEADHAITHSLAHGRDSVAHAAAVAQESDAEESHANTGAHGTHATSVYATMSSDRVEFHRQAYQWLYWMGIVTAFLTAFYTFRAFFMTFFGKVVVPEEAHGHAHESPPVMWWPLAVLSVFALFVGMVMFVQFEPDAFGGLLAATPSLGYAAAQATTQPGTFHLEVAGTSILIAFAGVGVAAFLYLGDRREIGFLTWMNDFGWLREAAELKWLAALGKTPALSAIQQGADSIRLGWLSRFVGFLMMALVGILLSPLLVGYYLSPFRLSQHKFYFDEIYDVLIVRPLSWLADGCYAIDRNLVDGTVNVCGKLAIAIGGGLRRLQGGLVPIYGIAMVLAALLFFAVRVLWAG